MKHLLTKSNWKYLPFSEAFLINPSCKLVRGNSYAYVQMSDVSPSSKLVYAKKQRRYRGSGSRFRDGDTLMARITPCLENGKIAQYRAVSENLDAAYGSTEFIVIRGRSGMTLSEYGYYLTSSRFVRHYAIGQMTGTSGRQRVPTAVLQHLIVPLPPLTEQRAIANILGTLDDKIELNQQMNETLEAIVQTLFRTWFINFDPVRAKMKGKDLGLPKHILEIFPNRLVDSELGEIPEGWKWSRIGNRTETKLGGTPLRKSPEFWSGDIPWINSGKVNEFRVISPSEFITTQGLANSATKLLPTRTTLIAITGSTLGQVSLNEIECCTNQSIVGVVGNDDMPSEFLYPWIKENINQLVKLQTGAAQQHINKGNVDQLTLICPSPKLMKIWVRVAKPIFDEIALKCFENATLAQIRDLLLTKLVSGELLTNNLEFRTPL